MKGINLLPDSFLKRRERARLRRRLLTWLVTFACVASAWWGAAAVQSRRLHAKAEGLRIEVERELQENAALAARASELRSVRASLSLQEQTQLPTPASLVLRVLPALLPESVALLSANLIVPQPVSQGSTAVRPEAMPGRKVVVKPALPRLELAGLAASELDVAQVVRGLSSSPLLANIKLESSRRVVLDGRECFQFRLQCDLNLHRSFIVKEPQEERAACE